MTGSTTSKGPWLGRANGFISARGSGRGPKSMAPVMNSACALQRLAELGRDQRLMDLADQRLAGTTRALSWRASST